MYYLMSMIFFCLFLYNEALTNFFFYVKFDVSNLNIIIAVVLVTLLMVALSSLVVLDVRSSEGIFYSGDSSTSLPQRTAIRP